MLTVHEFKELCKTVELTIDKLELQLDLQWFNQIKSWYEDGGLERLKKEYEDRPWDGTRFTYELHCAFLFKFFSIMQKYTASSQGFIHFKTILFLNDINLSDEDNKVLSEEVQHSPINLNPIAIKLSLVERRRIVEFTEKHTGILADAGRLYLSMNTLLPFFCVFYNRLKWYYHHKYYDQKRHGTEARKLFGPCKEVEKVLEIVEEEKRHPVVPPEPPRRPAPLDPQKMEPEDTIAPQHHSQPRVPQVVPFKEYRTEETKPVKKTRGPDKKGEPDEKIYIRVRDKTGEVEDEEYVSLVEIIQRYHERMMTRGKKEATERGENEGKIPETPVDTSDKTKPPRFIPREKWREERQEPDERRKREKKVRDREREQRVIDGARKKSPQYGSGKKEDKKQKGTNPFDEEYEEVRTIEV